jgi:hypothetical protein
VEVRPGGRDDGALLLVGGEGDDGLLDDVWIYRDRGTLVGLRRVTVVGLEDPSSPVVRMDLDLAPDWSRLAMRSGGRCPRGIEALERFWEARAIQAQGRLFANTFWGRGVVVGPDGSGGWREEGTHELGKWVQGTADAGGYSVWWGPGRLQVATSQ